MISKLKIFGSKFTANGTIIASPHSSCASKKLYQFLQEQVWLSQFYLAGGTALALQIGHRQSTDFDFFTAQEFDSKKIIQHLQRYADFELFSEAADTLHGLLNKVQVSFFRIPAPLVGKTLNVKNIHIASQLDIALMKLAAISGRGTKKDFIDLAFLLENFSIDSLSQNFTKKYGKGMANQYHLLKSLLYFEDAEKQPMPKMTNPLSWKATKLKIITHVKNSELV